MIQPLKAWALINIVLYPERFHHGEPNQQEKKSKTRSVSILYALMQLIQISTVNLKLFDAKFITLLRKLKASLKIIVD